MKPTTNAVFALDAFENLKSPFSSQSSNFLTKAALSGLHVSSSSNEIFVGNRLYCKVSAIKLSRLRATSNDLCNARSCLA